MHFYHWEFCWLQTLAGASKIISTRSFLDTIHEPIAGDMLTKSTYEDWFYFASIFPLRETSNPKVYKILPYQEDKEARRG